jgi:hypothetical protein
MRKLAFLCAGLGVSLGLSVGLGTFGCAKSEADTHTAPAAKAVPEPVPAQAAAPGGAPRLHAEGQGFTVDVTPPTAAAIGSESKARVVLRPTGGYHVNKEFPMILTVTAPSGVDVPKAKQQGADATKFEETEAVFDVPFTIKEAGDKAFAATFRFAVCTATTCDPKNEKLAWNVSVK